MFTMVGGTKAYYIAADGEKLGRRSVLSGYHLLFFFLARWPWLFLGREFCIIGGEGCIKRAHVGELDARETRGARCNIACK